MSFMLYFLLWRDERNLQRALGYDRPVDRQAGTSKVTNCDLRILPSVPS